jgi:hypothetical protein
MHENHEQRNQQGNLPLFNDDYSNDLKRKERITTGLPPREGFTFIVCKQDCLHTFQN